MTKNVSPIEYDDITLAEVPVKIAGKSYILRGASGGAAAQYRNATMACFTLGPNGKPQRIGNMADVESLLVSLCLKDEKGAPVAQQSVKLWPHHIVTALFERAKEISDLTDTDTKGLIHKAFARADCPIGIAVLRDWAAQLGPEFSSVHELFDVPEEDAAKN